MPTETELKLRIDPTSVKTLLESDLLVGEPVLVEQAAIYFDTPDQTLRRSGYSLRIRKEGDGRTQTVKATTTSSAGLFARSEWEFAVGSDEPVIDHSTPLQSHLGEKLDGLQPVFDILIERRKWNVVEGGSEIEVVLDRGFVKAADRQMPICEIELELKSGGISSLFEFARAIDGVIPFQFEVLSKSERGYRLLEPAAKPSRRRASSMSAAMISRSTPYPALSRPSRGDSGATLRSLHLSCQ